MLQFAIRLAATYDILLDIWNFIDALILGVTKVLLILKLVFRKGWVGYLKLVCFLFFLGSKGDASEGAVDICGEVTSNKPTVSIAKGRTFYLESSGEGGGCVFGLLEGGESAGGTTDKEQFHCNSAFLSNTYPNHIECHKDNEILYIQLDRLQDISSTFDLCNRVEEGKNFKFLNDIEIEKTDGICKVSSEKLVTSGKCEKVFLSNKGISCNIGSKNNYIPFKSELGKHITQLTFGHKETLICASSSMLVLSEKKTHRFIYRKEGVLSSKWKLREVEIYSGRIKKFGDHANPLEVQYFLDDGKHNSTKKFNENKTTITNGKLVSEFYPRSTIYGLCCDSACGDHFTLKKAVDTDLKKVIDPRTPGAQ